jgi:uroporphyrinogen decarboxylase
VTASTFTNKPFFFPGARISIRMRPDIDTFIQTLRRRKGPYVPHAELGIHPTIKERLLGRPIVTLKDDVDFWHKAGYDYVKLQPIVDFNPGLIGTGNVTYNADGTVFRKWASEGSGVIDSEAAFERYRFPTTSEIEYSRFERVREVLPDGMGVIGQYGDIFTMTWEMMGFEAFSMAIFEQPELVRRLNNTVGAIVLSMFEYFAECRNVDVLWYSDDIAYASGLMVSPKVLQMYFFPWLKRIGDLARRSGKPLIYHTDGLLYDVMDEIIACGVDALHPIEPKAMELAEVKKRYGDRLCLIGHVDVDLLARGTPEEVRQQVKRNIEVAAYNGGYCAGSGNSIPEYVKFENYFAMLRAVAEFGGN